jgi:transcriptional regulator of acetoin/glycerol metabolism
MWTRYSDEQRAAVLAALDANNGNLSKTARDTGVPKSTLVANAAV